METSEDIQTLVERLFQERERWEVLIKEIRKASGAGLLEAQKIALSHKGWRRLCNHRINHERPCRKQALWHLKHHGPDSFIAAQGDILVVIDHKLGGEATTSDTV